MDYTEVLRKQAQDKVNEVVLLQHDLALVNRKIDKTQKYIESMNEFLIQNGEEPVIIPEVK